MVINCVLLCVQVCDDRVLGERGRGYQLAIDLLNEGRIGEELKISRAQVLI